MYNGTSRTPRYRTVTTTTTTTITRTRRPPPPPPPPLETRSGDLAFRTRNQQAEPRASARVRDLRELGALRAEVLDLRRDIAATELDLAEARYRNRRGEAAALSRTLTSLSGTLSRVRQDIADAERRLADDATPEQRYNYGLEQADSRSPTPTHDTSRADFADMSRREIHAALREHEFLNSGNFATVNNGFAPSTRSSPYESPASSFYEDGTIAPSGTGTGPPSDWRDGFDPTRRSTRPPTTIGSWGTLGPTPPQSSNHRTLTSYDPRPHPRDNVMVLQNYADEYELVPRRRD
jgi:hypothetical protein